MLLENWNSQGLRHRPATTDQNSGEPTYKRRKVYQPFEKAHDSWDDTEITAGKLCQEAARREESFPKRLHKNNVGMKKGEVERNP